MGKLLYFFYVYLFSILLPIVIGFSRYSKLDRGMRVLHALLILLLFMETSAFCLALYGHNNNSLYLVYFPIEGIIYSYIFAGWQKRGRDKLIIYFALVVFLALYFFSTVKNYIPGNLNLYNSTFMCLFYSIITSYLLFQLQKADYGIIFEDFRFWIYAALFFYSAGDIIFIVFIMLLKDISIIWLIHMIVNIFSYCGFAYSFRICNKKREELTAAGD